MNKKLGVMFFSAAVAASGVFAVHAKFLPGVIIGEAAPDFAAKDTNGGTQSLSSYKGKTIVLEWLNYGCPFVKKQYNSKNMQSLQKEYTGKGVVWLSVISSAPGKQGNMPADKVNDMNKQWGGHATAILLDYEAKVAREYGARTTPHMFVIDPKGVLVYEGAIDDKPTTDVEDIKSAKNYVRDALNSVLAGKPVAVSYTKSYGCSVKY